MSRFYSTREVADMVGINKQTLLRWIWAGKISEPAIYESGGVKLRNWSHQDIERVQRYKNANYRKGRGRKQIG